MDAFRTELNPKTSVSSIALDHPIVTLGSCFADNIGEKLESSKFKVLVNPFGTTYNPLSIHQHLRRMNYNEPPADHSYLAQEAIHFNYDFHSRFSARSKKTLESNIRETLGHGHHFLNATRHILITYGTAWAYERVDTGEVVANCHKLPSNTFKKFLLTQKRILESFDEVYQSVKSQHPDIRFILTVSPVRHLKDTLELNSVSKSVLRVTCHTLSEMYTDVEYFPAYEILLDDLRDYRFYDTNLLHPTPDAIAYIWKKFSEAYFDRETKVFLEKWTRITNALAHKPFHADSPSHQNFIKETIRQLEELKTMVSVEKEVNQLKSQLTTA